MAKAPAILIFALLALALPATAQVYKWVDKDGKVHYSDKKPRDPKAKDVKDLGIESKPTDPAAVERELAELAERGKVVDESLRVKQQVGAQTAAEKERAQKMCDDAKARLQVLNQINQLVSVDRDGKQTYSSDKELASQKALAQQKVADLCQ